MRQTIQTRRPLRQLRSSPKHQRQHNLHKSRPANVSNNHPLANHTSIRRHSISSTTHGIMNLTRTRRAPTGSTSPRSTPLLKHKPHNRHIRRRLTRLTRITNRYLNHPPLHQRKKRRNSLRNSKQSRQYIHKRRLANVTGRSKRSQSTTLRHRIRNTLLRLA